MRSTWHPRVNIGRRPSCKNITQKQETAKFDCWHIYKTTCLVNMWDDFSLNVDTRRRSRSADVIWRDPWRMSPSITVYVVAPDGDGEGQVYAGISSSHSVFYLTTNVYDMNLFTQLSNSALEGPRKEERESKILRWRFFVLASFFALLCLCVTCVAMPIGRPLLITH